MVTNLSEDVMKMFGLNVLIHTLLEINGCVLSTVATDDLVLKHQAISNYIANWIFFVVD